MLIAGLSVAFAVEGASARTRHRGCRPHHRCHAPKAPRCAGHEKTTLGAGGGARVFYIGGDWAEYPSASTIYGCAPGASRAVKLEYFADTMSASPSHVLVDSAHAAYAVTVTDESCLHYAPAGVSCTAREIKSFDLRAGKQLVSASDAPDALVMTDAGWLAWVPAIDTKAPGRSVVAFDSAGRRMLDSGAIDPSSLTVSRATVSWMKGAASYSATLG